MRARGSMIASPWPGCDAAASAACAGARATSTYSRHVAAARRVDHRPRALEHGVAGEEHALLLEEEAEVVRGVARRVQHLEAELGALDRVAVADEPVRHDAAVVLVALRERDDLRARRLHQPRGRRRRDRGGCG